MIPKYLYHYTSCETLEAIFKSRKIRFNRLDRLNDKYEGFNVIEGEDHQHLRKCIYVSCWNAEEKDMIPLWNLYAEFRGLRVKLPTNLFNIKNQWEQVKLSDSFVLASVIDPILVDAKISVPNDEWDKCRIVDKVIGPVRIEYVTNLEDICRNAISQKKEKGSKDSFLMIETRLSELGLKKIEDWAFEKEWRYVIQGLKAVKICGSKQIIEQFDRMVILPDYIDIPYRPEAMQGIEILIGPLANDGVQEKVENLLKRYEIKGSVKRSPLKIALKNK